MVSKHTLGKRSEICLALCYSCLLLTWLAEVVRMGRVCLSYPYSSGCSALHSRGAQEGKAVLFLFLVLLMHPYQPRVWRRSQESSLPYLCLGSCSPVGCAAQGGGRFWGGGCGCLWEAVCPCHAAALTHPRESLCKQDNLPTRSRFLWVCFLRA